VVGPIVGGRDRAHPDRTVPEPTEAEAWAILLTVTGLGPASFGALLREFGGGRTILAAAARPGAAAKLAAVIATVEGRGPIAPTVGRGIVELARATARPLRVLRATDLTIVTLDDPFYPARLRAIDLPPPVLFVRGEVTVLAAARAVAIVGTRRPSERGRLTAARIAAAVGDTGAVVVSGLAVGIDGAVHAAAVTDGRPTIAVLGSGHGHLFPRAHVRLAERIVATGGAVISEMWPELEPTAGTFPRRNRLISGLSSATIVVEAGIHSGALITADWALKQGRECFFVPGPIDEPRSAGCLQWLRDYPGAARIVARIPDLIEDLGLFDAAGQAPTIGRRPSLEAELIELGQTAREVARALLATHGTLDELVAATGHEVATVLGAITLLELRGLVTTTYGRYRAAGRLASAATPSTGPPGRRPSASRTAARGTPPEAPRLPHRSEPC
jgi:DNA processing protein